MSLFWVSHLRRNDGSDPEITETNLGEDRLIELADQIIITRRKIRWKEAGVVGYANSFKKVDDPLWLSDPRT